MHRRTTTYAVLLLWMFFSSNALVHHKILQPPRQAAVIDSFNSPQKQLRNIRLPASRNAVSPAQVSVSHDTHSRNSPSQVKRRVPIPGVPRLSTPHQGSVAPVDGNHTAPDNFIFSEPKMLHTWNHIMDMPMATIAELSYLCSLAYYAKRRPASLQKISVSSRNEEVDYGFVDIDNAGKRIIITFRGTRSVQDLMYDFKTDIERGGGHQREHGRLLGFHRGFLELAMTLYPKVCQILDKNLNDSMDLYAGYEFLITGHSLGGAVAQIISIFLYHDQKYALSKNGGALNNANQFKVVTFSAPRVFDSRIQSYPLGDCLVRFQHTGDLVTRFPFGDSFGHQGRLVEVGSFHDGVFEGAKDAYVDWNPFYLHSIGAMTDHLHKVTATLKDVLSCRDRYRP